VDGHSAGDGAHPFGHPSQIQARTEVDRLVVIEQFRFRQLLDPDAITPQQVSQVLFENGKSDFGVRVGEHGTDSGSQQLRDSSLAPWALVVGGIAGNLAPNPIGPQIQAVGQLRKVGFDRQSAETRLQTGGDIMMIGGAQVEDQARSSHHPLPKCTLHLYGLQGREVYRI